MPRTYDIIYEHGVFPKDPEKLDEADAPDNISVSPYAVIAIWRYKYPVTFSRRTGQSIAGAPDIDVATDIRENVLLIVDDLQHLQVQHTKTNHVSQLSAGLLPGMNYLTEAFPGDWIGAWIVNDARKFKSLKRRLQAGEPCNEFYDGLKFLGRVTSLRKRITQNPQGVRTTTYALNAAGFTELDASIYYEPYLASKSIGIASEWLRETGIKVSSIIAQNGQGIDIMKALPTFLDAFYGSGIPKNQGFKSVPGMADRTAGLDNPSAFIVPDPIARMLGVESGSKQNGKKGWNDIMEVLWGIQKFQLSQNNRTGLRQRLNESKKEDKDYVPGNRAGLIFSPDAVDGDPNSRRRRTGFPMLGTFLPSPPQFNGQKTVWAILQQYLNPTINEMYACLRVNPAGRIFPTLVMRQLPFSSGLLAEEYTPKPQPLANELHDQKKGDRKRPRTKPDQKENPINATRKLTLTRFMELPRWRVHPILVKNVDIGRSDSLRFNFIHVYGETGLQNQNRTGYLVRDPPVRDDIDIARSGLRPYLASVNCARADAEGRRSGDWMYILSDILMGQHLVLTGTIDLVGVQAPICPGDNIEFDKHVFHIEAVSHSFNQNPDGMKSFSTSLALTHGMKAEQATGADLALYSGSDGLDLTRHDAGQSREYRFSPTPASDPDPGSEASQQAPKSASVDAPDDQERTLIDSPGILGKR